MASSKALLLLGLLSLILLISFQASARQLTESTTNVGETAEPVEKSEGYTWDYDNHKCKDKGTGKVTDHRKCGEKGDDNSSYYTEQEVQGYKLGGKELPPKPEGTKVVKDDMPMPSENDYSVNEDGNDSDDKDGDSGSYGGYGNDGNGKGSDDDKGCGKCGYGSYSRLDGYGKSGYVGIYDNGYGFDGYGKAKDSNKDEVCGKCGCDGYSQFYGYVDGYDYDYGFGYGCDGYSKADTCGKCGYGSDGKPCYDGGYGDKKNN